MAQESATETATTLAPGIWAVDQAGSEVGFTVRTFWGMMPVKGRFDSFSGSLDVRDPAATGELTIAAASLNTGNKARDKHLRSADFFDVEQHRDITFTIASMDQSAGALKIAGSLTIGAKTIPLELDVALESGDATHAKLKAGTRIAREQAGMTWNRAGMVAGDADLRVELALTRQ